MKALATELQARFPTNELLRAFVATIRPAESGLLPDADLVKPASYALASASLLRHFQPGFEVERIDDTDSPVVGSGIQRLPSFGDFFAACVSELESSRTVRLTIVGPTFLEPEWWHEREADSSDLPDFSLELASRITSSTLEVCEVILRNTADRYASSLREYVADNIEWNRLLDEMVERSYDLFGDRGEIGPRVRCLDPGFSHLPHIFDNAALIGVRPSPTERVSGGWRLSSPDLLGLERERWYRLFTDSESTQHGSVETMRHFVESLRGRFES